MKTQLTEQEVRKLRDNIYGTLPKFRTDDGWEHVKDKWMTPENIEWLQSQPQNKPKP